MMRCLRAIGAAGIEEHKGRVVYAHKGAAFLVSKPIDGKAATHANGGTIGFPSQFPSRPTPGMRPGSPTAARRSRIRPASAKASFGKLYLAYLRDPDGNKLCALHRPG